MPAIIDATSGEPTVIDIGENVVEAKRQADLAAGYAQDAQDTADAFAALIVEAPSVPEGDYAIGIYNPVLNRSAPFMRADGVLATFKAGVPGALIERVATGSEVPAITFALAGDDYALALENRDLNIVVPVVDSAGFTVSRNRNSGIVERVATISEVPSEVLNLTEPGIALALENPDLDIAAPIMDSAGRVMSRNRMTGLYETVATDADAMPFAAGARQTYSGETWADPRQTSFSFPSAVSTTWVVYIRLGQSNAMGQNTNSSDAIIAGTPLYPSNVWMFQGGPISVGAGNSKLVPAAESVKGGQRETSATSFGNHLYKILNDRLGIAPNILVSVAALGSRNYLQLKRGTPTYSDFLNLLDNIQTALRLRGATKIIPVVVWQGSESSCGISGITQLREERHMMQLERDVREDIVARLGSEPLMLINQISFYYTQTDSWDQPVRMAQGSIDGRGSRIRARGAWYQMPMDLSTAEVIHASCLGQNRIGIMDAHAAAHELFGSGHIPFRAVRWWFSSATQIKVQYACNPGVAATSPPALVLDNTDTFVKTSTLVTQGFRFRDGSGSPPAITGVSVSGMIATIDLASAPTGTRRQLAYAIERDAGNTQVDGNISGARGALRNNVPHVSLYDGVTNYDWAMAQVMDF